MDLLVLAEREQGRQEVGKRLGLMRAEGDGGRVRIFEVEAPLRLLCFLLFPPSSLVCRGFGWVRVSGWSDTCQA
jgi:hypothetical protein